MSRDDGKRPDGMTIFPWKKGRCLVWDFTCSDTLAPSHIASSSKEVSKIAENKENFKLSKYSKLQESYLVVPVCVETLGSYGPNGIKFIVELGKKIKEETREPKSLSYLRQAISIAVQRGNAGSIMGAVVPSKNLEEVYYL